MPPPRIERGTFSYSLSLRRGYTSETRYHYAIEANCELLFGNLGQAA